MIDETLVVELYVQDGKSLRSIAKELKTNHHAIKRILDRNNIKLFKRKKRELSNDHKKKISKSHDNRVSYPKGYKQKKITVYRNMIAKLQYEIDERWILQFDDIEKLKYLNRSVIKATRGSKWTTLDYKKFIEVFYHDESFNFYYEKWMITKDPWMKPSLDHIIPISKGGTSEIENLQFLTWFANRAKVDMTNEQWEKLKLNINDYI